MKRRLDHFLIDQGLAVNKIQAQQMIKEGSVRVNGVREENSGLLVDRWANVVVEDEAIPFVEKSGLKLAFALDTFEIKVRGKYCLDIGAGRGGFSDCLLQKGADRVFAVEPRKNLLDDNLRKNELIELYEGIPVEDFQIEGGGKVDFVAIEIEGVSATEVIPEVSRLLEKDGEGVVLIRPQCENNGLYTGKDGVVRDEVAIEKAIEEVGNSLLRNGYKVLGIIESPVTATEGNREYLLHFRFA